MKFDKFLGKMREKDGGVTSVSGFAPDDSGNVNIYAGNLLIRAPQGEDDYPPTINDKFSTLDAYVMTMPDYYRIQSDYSANTDYIADTPGWLIIEWISHNITDNSAVTIDGQTFKLGNNYSNIGDIWQTYTFPLSAGSTWSIYDDESRGYRICFLPCNPDYVVI